MQNVLPAAQLEFSTAAADEFEVDETLKGSSLLVREPRMPPTVAAIAIMMTMMRMIIIFLLGGKTHCAFNCNA